MAYDRRHMLLSWSGDILGKPGQPQDGAFPIADFSGSMRFASTSSATGANSAEAHDNDASMTDVMNDLINFWANPNGFIPSTFVIREVKWNLIGTDGKYVDQTNTRLTDGLDVRGGVTGSMPSFVCVASTYTTGARRGLAHKGRTYWPHAGAPGGAGGLLSSEQQGKIASQVAGLLKAWGNWTGVDLDTTKPVVMSSLRAGQTRAITGVSVGNEFDVIQRRRIGRESYVSATV